MERLLAMLSGVFGALCAPCCSQHTDCTALRCMRSHAAVPRSGSVCAWGAAPKCRPQLRFGAGDAAGGLGLDPRRKCQLMGITVRGVHAIWARAARSRHTGLVGCSPRDPRRACRMVARVPNVADRSGRSTPRRLTIIQTISSEELRVAGDIVALPRKSTPITRSPET
jgi:hypothetical protein